MLSHHLLRFQTYFPHVDNIYSHRSTQRYKRKPFISHYWDCRLKGRPPGTPKSEDPTKRKRKRQARERDLCDVKIKITEYFPGARTILGPDFNSIIEDAPDVPHVFAPGINYGPPLRQPQPFGMLALSESPRPDQPGSKGERYYTIQRVNGNGGNGKGDGVAGPHKHTLEESDRVKKNSIQRHFLKEEKQMKKSQVITIHIFLASSIPVASEVVQAATHYACSASYLEPEHDAATICIICGKCFMYLSFHTFTEPFYFLVLYKQLDTR